MYWMVHLTLKPSSEVKQNKVTNDVNVAGSMKLPAIFPNVGYRLQARDQAAKSGKVVYLRCLPLLADNEQLSFTRLIQ